MPKISIIIPVYNVEQYLMQCVNSAINQTLSDIEIILVDDGSPDKSPQMCDELAAQDTRIHVIHQENSGLGAARNAGLDVASGEFVFFLDSDDWIDETCCEDMYNSAIRNDADLVLAGETLFFEETQEFGPGWRDFDGQKPTVITRYNFLDYFTPVCGRLYRKDFLDKYSLRFIKNCCYEDNSWGVLVSCLAKKVSFARNHYFYRQHKMSITGTKDYKIIDWCYDFYYFDECAKKHGLSDCNIIWGYQWYVLNFYNYINNIRNLSEENQKVYMTLLTNICNRMKLTRKDFYENSIYKANISKLYKFYKRICSGHFNQRTTRYFLMGLIPIGTISKEYNVSTAKGL